MNFPTIYRQEAGYEGYSTADINHLLCKRKDDSGWSQILKNHSQGVRLGYNQETGDIWLNFTIAVEKKITAMYLLFLLHILIESVCCGFPESVSVLCDYMLGVWEQIICLFIQIKRNNTPVAVPEELHLRNLNHTWTWIRYQDSGHQADAIIRWDFWRS